MGPLSPPIMAGQIADDPNQRMETGLVPQNRQNHLDTPLGTGLIVSLILFSVACFSIEMALGAGACAVVVWQGRNLTDEEFPAGGQVFS